jgi:hypothetical protein
LYCRDTNKNEILENLIRQHELCIHNESTPTFLYSNNIIDLMIGTKSISDKITNIEKNDDFTSDHLMLCAKLTCMEYETANENEF